MKVAWWLLALSISLPPLVSEDVLEPSIRNEVEHALAIAPTNVVMTANSTNDCLRALLGTNALNRTEIAIRLVSSQKGDGHWRVGTNDLTAAAVHILKNL